MSAIEAERGVGQCPDRPDGFGHVWAGALASGDRNNPCRFCGYAGRRFLAEATRARAAGFENYERPSKEQMAETAAAIVEDKKRRDAEAVANGTARPGQIAGAKGKRS